MNNAKQIVQLQEQFDKRFKDFATKLNEDKPILDGILMPEKYITANKKILFIAKEPNDEDGGWDFKYPTEPYKNNNFWFPLKYIAYGILHPDISWGQIPVVTENKYVDDVLSNTAYININKFPSGSTTDMEILKEKYQIYKDFILEQLKIINPDIIICMGTFEVIQKDIINESFQSLDKSYKKVYYTSQLIVLDCHHVGYSYGNRGIKWEDYCVDAINGVKSCIDR